MEDIPSSTSSSRAPFRGLALALLLLAGLRAVRPPRQDFRGAEPSDPGLPVQPAASLPRGWAPDVLLVGDSRMYPVRFEAFAEAYAPGGPLPTGRVWGEGGGSVPDLLEHLEELDVRPRLLVLGASPLSMALAAYTRSFRSGTDPDIPAALRWKWALRDGLMRPLSFLPSDRGPALAANRLRPLLLGPDARRAEAEWERAAPPNIVGYQQAFAQEPAPSGKTIEATVRAIRRMRERGARVLLVRLPVSPELYRLEDDWGAGEVLGRIGRDSGAPLADLNRMPVYPLLRDGILDGSHVTGEGTCRLLSRALGRLAREAAGRYNGAHKETSMPDPAPPAVPAAFTRFHRDMTVGEAMRLHPAVAEVFAAFHLGGCSHCGISEQETIGQIAMGYGIDEAMLLGALEDLFKTA